MKNAKIQAVKEFISQYAGIMVDMTIRDSKSFTFHFDGENNNAMIKIAKYFISGNAKVERLGGAPQPTGKTHTPSGAFATPKQIGYIKR